MKQIRMDELKTMELREGLIIQGCGGDPQEWIDGINEILTNEGILLNGHIFKDAYVFQNKDVTNILFSMADVDLDGGKLAMWRLASHSSFGGTWLSDYRVNKLDMESGEPMQEQAKPDCPLIGADGNIFNLMGLAARTLRRSDLADQAKEMSERITSSGSYDEALNIIGEYVNIVSAEDMQEQGGMEMQQNY